MLAVRESPFCPQCGAPTEARERFGRLRPVCMGCGHTVYFDPKVAVVAFIVQETQGVEAVLLVQRAHDPGRGCWALPAGFIEPDEAPSAALTREVAEETGLRVQVTALIGLLHRPDPDGMADLVIAYRAQVVGGILLAGDDASAVGWFRQDALPPIALATTDRLIASWGAGLDELQP